MQIKITVPPEDRLTYRDRDGNISINMTAMSRPTNIIHFVTNRPGSFHDSTCFEWSSLYKMLEISKWRPFPGAMIIGDR